MNTRGIAALFGFLLFSNPGVTGASAKKSKEMEHKSMNGESAALTADPAANILIEKGLNAQQKSVAVGFFRELSLLNQGIKNYFNLAFTHIPGIRFIYLTKTEMNSATPFYAKYEPAMRAVILLNSDFKSKDKDYFAHAEAVRHELSHASQHAIQLSLGGVDTISSDIHYPRESKEQEGLVHQMIQKGDNKAATLYQWLSLEEKGKLNHSQQKELDSLRKDSMEEYDAYYRRWGMNDYTKAESDRYGFRIGSIAHIDYTGPIMVQNITPLSSGKST